MQQNQQTGTVTPSQASALLFDAAKRTTKRTPQRVTVIHETTARDGVAVMLSCAVYARRSDAVRFLETVHGCRATAPKSCESLRCKYAFYSNKATGRTFAVTEEVLK